MIDAPVVSRSVVDSHTLLTVALPLGLSSSGAAGRFLLARTALGGADTRAWDPLLRQPLFPARVEPAGEAALWSLLLPPANAHAAPWPLRAEPAALTYLHSLRPGLSLNLLGPYGVGFDLQPRTRTLLLAADLPRAPLLLPLLDTTLDAGGRVLFLLESADAAFAAAFLNRLPLAVEARVETPAGLAAALQGAASWADQICLALPHAAIPMAAAALRAGRVRLLPSEAQALVEAPLPCGVGACLACVVGLVGGSHTRACVHGPVLDLTRLA